MHYTHTSGDYFQRLRECKTLFSLAGALLIICLLAGCAESEPDEYLIRVNDRITTACDFNRAFEIAKIAHPRDVTENPTALRKIRLRLLNQIVEEMILLERAEELQIDIFDPEVKEAFADIKKGYPDGVLEQALLEQAIPYNLWKERLKVRLLIEKVVAEELARQVTITPEDISRFYAEHYREESLKSDLKSEPNDLKETITEQLRRKKMEEAYKPWIEKLREKYIVEINISALEHLGISTTY